MTTTHQKSFKPRVRIGPRSAGLPMTTAEFDAIPAWAWNDLYRYELINGVLVVTPIESATERAPNEFLGYLLRRHESEHPQSSALDVTLPIPMVPNAVNRRRCDRALWIGLGRLPDTEHDVPAILVDFVSLARRHALREFEAKRDEYLSAGASEYWVIDRFRRTLTVYRQGRIGPTHQIVTEAQNYETRLLPGFVLPIARLFIEADQWKKARPKRSRKPPAGGTDG